MIEGILSIQAGDNPRLLEEKLHAFLDPNERETEVEEGGTVGEPDYGDDLSLGNGTTRLGGGKGGGGEMETAGMMRWLLTYADMITLLLGAVHHLVLDLDDQQGEAAAPGPRPRRRLQQSWTRSTTRPTA